MTVGTLASAQGPSRSDIRFMREAAQGGMAEVRLGELATRRGASERVRGFGQHMIDDHSKANDNLREIAIRKGVTLPPDIGAEHRAVLARLSRLHGVAFDAAYIRDMKLDHQQDIAAFRAEAASGRDEAIRRFAERTLPTLRDHYSMVKDISSHMRERRMRMGRM